MVAKIFRYRNFCKPLQSVNIKCDTLNISSFFKIEQLIKIAFI